MSRSHALLPVVIASLCLLGPGLSVAEIKTETPPPSTLQMDSSQSKTSEADVDKSRGQLLYETHCGGCHETSVHGRNPRKAGSLGDIKHWVTVWNKELKLNWTDSDIHEVTRFLNFRYYQFAE